MQRFRLAVAALSVAVLTASTVSAVPAMMIAPAPIGKRVAGADLVIVGKVTGFGAKLESAPAFPGAKDKAEYQIATVKVDDALFGGKGLKEVRVGFIPAPVGPGPGPGPGPRIGPRRYPTFSLAADQEVCLFLVKHHEGDFYVGQAYYDVIDKKNANFDKDLTEVKRCAKLLADPKAGLESKTDEDRVLTALMLISRYRTSRQSASPPKTEDVDAAESKLILKTLADANWDAKPTIGFQMTPVAAFAQLGLTEKEGWKAPADFNQMGEKAKEWLKANGDKYRIKRFVAEEKKKDDKKG